MQRKELELFFEEFNPDEDGKVSRSAILTSYQARTGAYLDIAVAALSETTRLPPDQQGVDQLRGRRRRGRDLQQVPEQGGASLSAGINGIDSIWHRKTLVSASPVPAILATSRADRGAEVAGAAEGGARIGDCTDDRINLETFRAIVDGASQPGAEDQEDLAVEMTRGIDQVESRTPPAMERNLFLSALANGKLEHHRDDVVTTLKRVVAGGLAGMLAKSVVAPVDRVKILFQVTNETFSFKKAEKLFQDILALEGPAGLWKGNSATMIRVFPYAGTQFMMFDSLKRWALLRKTRRDPNAEQRLSNMESLMSGSFAGATSALVTYPLDLARARLAVGHSRKIGGARRRSMGVSELLRTVVRKEGPAALYRGVTPSLMGIIPYAGIAFSINEQAKHEVVILTGKEPGTIHKLGIGAFAGLIAQSCTYPLEVTRRRMQTHGHVDTHAGVNKVFEVPKAGIPTDVDAMRRLNIFQTLTTVFKEQGAGGLFKGLSMNWVKGPVGISISFTTFDFLKRRFGIS